MPITVNDNDFPPSYDSTLNLIQLVKSYPYLIKQITGNLSWLDLPETSIKNLLTSVNQNTNDINILTQDLTNAFTSISSNTTAINAINAISRPRILWKTTRAQNFTIGTSATTLYTITIPAGTCSIDSILNLHINIYGSNTTNTKTFTVICNATTITSFNLAQNTTYPYRKRIAFNNALNAPYCTAIGDGGYSTIAGIYLSGFADFSQAQTITVRATASVANESVFVNGGYLELI
ncbi:MAG: hypothetical protein KAF91_31115 [Nostoc sp. TH1S01]|nr:hypothetical protein [Nostoc sp. TH1S01]